jgi:hypothetical protein
LLLFGLNWLDAQLTLLWIHLNVATEGNALMARVLAHGDSTFLIFKRGLSAALVVYLGLMIVHAATGCLALGWQGPVNVLAYVGSLPGAVVSLFG